MDSLNLEPSLITVKAILILDNDGKRIICKYYDETFPTLKDQHKFEESLFQKTHRANAEIIMHEGVTAVYKSNVDLFFYILGAQNENEPLVQNDSFPIMGLFAVQKRFQYRKFQLMLMGVLTGLYDAISLILRRNIEKRTLLEHMDALLLVLEELVDGGVIVETDPNVLIQRIAIRVDEGTFSEQSVKHVIQSAKENLKWSLLK